jgi:hypothetical protein
MESMSISFIWPSSMVNLLIAEKRGDSGDTPEPPARGFAPCTLI